MPFSIRPSRRLPLTYFLGFWSLIILLVLSSGPVYAEWMSLGASGSGTTVYADPATIRQEGESREYAGIVRLQDQTNQGGRLLFVGKGANGI